MQATLHCPIHTLRDEVSQLQWIDRQIATSRILLGEISELLDFRFCFVPATARLDRTFPLLEPRI
jgi:hypothetical protein